jgi:hypothetical protein
VSSSAIRPDQERQADALRRQARLERRQRQAEREPRSQVAEVDPKASGCPPARRGQQSEQVRDRGGDRHGARQPRRAIAAARRRGRLGGSSADDQEPERPEQVLGAVRKNELQIAVLGLSKM